jgi:Transglutaminase-like superfamily
MHRLGRFLRLTAREKALLLQAILLLGAIRLGLSLFPFAAVRGVLTRLASVGIKGERQSAADATVTEGAVWAVETAGRHFPTIGTCLHQALAAHVILARRGCRSNLRIGVKRGAGGKFMGHAWLEKDGNVLIGGAHRSTYIPMPILNGLEPYGAPQQHHDSVVQWPSESPSTRHNGESGSTRSD